MNAKFVETVVNSLLHSLNAIAPLAITTFFFLSTYRNLYSKYLKLFNIESEAIIYTIFSYAFLYLSVKAIMKIFLTEPNDIFKKREDLN